MYTRPSYQPDLFATSLPRYLGCSDDFGNVVHLPKAEALRKPYIAPNSKYLVWSSVYDIDRPDAGAAWIDHNAPRPNWICQNPKNGHAHLGYALAVPVSRSLQSRGGPLRYLARVEDAMTIRLDADRAYTHYLTKTPGHPTWRTLWGRRDPYSLIELRGYLDEDLPRRVRRATATGLGRNVSLFDGLRYWAYRARLGYDDYAAWLRACLNHASVLNVFPCPLPHSEVRSTARSVAKWTWRNITAERFSEVQRHRQARMVTKRLAKAMDNQALLFSM